MPAWPPTRTRSTRSRRRLGADLPTWTGHPADPSDDAAPVTGPVAPVPTPETVADPVPPVAPTAPRVRPRTTARSCPATPAHPTRPTGTEPDGARRGRVHRRDDQHGLRSGRRRQRPGPRRRGHPGPNARAGRRSPTSWRSTAAGRRPATSRSRSCSTSPTSCARRWRTRRSTARSSSRARTRSRRPRFCWDLVLDGPKPVVVTGAMRASDEAGFDGPANLRDAVRVAAAASMRGDGRGRLPGRHDRARRRRDQDARLGARHVPEPERGLARAGRPRTGVALYRRRAGRRARADRASRRTGPAHHRDRRDGRLAARTRRSPPERTGSSSPRPAPGNTDPSLLAAAVRAIDAGIPVAHASRCPAGRAGAAYAFPGGGAEWIRAGALPVGHLCAVKARVALALGLGAGLDRAGLVALLADPEDSDRAARDAHHRADRHARRRDRVRLGRGGRDPRRADRLRRLRGRARDARGPVHGADRARARRGGDPGPDRRAPAPRRRRGRHPPDRPVRCADAGRGAGPYRRRARGAPAIPDAWLEGHGWDVGSLGPLADRRRPRDGRARAVVPRSGRTTTTPCSPAGPRSRRPGSIVRPRTPAAA